VRPSTVDEEEHTAVIDTQMKESQCKSKEYSESTNRV